MKTIDHGKCVGLAAYVLAWAAAGCTAPASDGEPPANRDDEVIVAMGHGRYLGAGFQRLDPSPELFARTQRALLARMTASARAAGFDVDGARARIANQEPDEFLANAALIDALLEHAPPGDHATIQTVNLAMRGEYTRATGNTPSVAERVTFNSGEKYIEECRAAGVPIPPPMYRTGAGNWNPRGPLTTNFLGGDAQLWEYRASNGLCLALPRYDASGIWAKPFGVICLGTGSGTGTNKACFWDNPKDTAFQKDVEVPLTSFVGGYDLAYNAQGVCSDCHAGANPFVVHPQDPAFAGIAYADLPPSRWYEPIVHVNWPQNRGPSNLLAGEPSTGRCDQGGCHEAGPAGRAGQFPILSTELRGYCNTVLWNAALSPMPQTMPPGLSNLADYENHREKLRRACRSLPDTGKIDTAPAPIANPTFLSPPTLQAVAYDCAQMIEVNNVVPDATVTVTVTTAAGTTSYTRVADNVAHIEFTLAAPLEVGNLITATQSLGVLTSSAATLTVRDHHLDFAVVPTPEINPDLIYECADVIAVGHVPGAKVTVFSSYDPPVTGWTSSGWSSFWPGTRPFRIGDTFRAQASLCPTEPSSGVSPAVPAVTAPTTLPTPTFDPARAFEGQRFVSIRDLVNGEHTRFTASGSFAGELDAPISWWTNYNLSTTLGRSLRLGETVAGQPRLCSSGPIATIPVSKCSELPAPRIETPLLPGDTAVVVAIAQPGARIHVYDGSGAEIGNGAGTVITLSRALAPGDEVRVVQEVGACRSATAHLVYVRAPGQ